MLSLTRARTRRVIVAGLEGGLEEDVNGRLQCFAWMLVLSGNNGAEKMGVARTATFELPEKVGFRLRNHVPFARKCPFKAL